MLMDSMGWHLVRVHADVSGPRPPESSRVTVGGPDSVPACGRFMWSGCSGNDGWPSRGALLRGYPSGAIMPRGMARDTGNLLRLASHYNTSVFTLLLFCVRPAESRGGKLDLISPWDVGSSRWQALHSPFLENAINHSW